jgi:hypothetical protein
VIVGVTLGVTLGVILGVGLGVGIIVSSTTNDIVSVESNIGPFISIKPEE